MASSRLPGKVMLDIVGQPMLHRVHRRTARARRLDAVAIATTQDPGDDPVARFCEAQGLLHARGSQFDVLDRYYRAAQQFEAEIIVRITADCPAIDPELIDDAVDELLAAPKSTLASPDMPRSKPAYDFVANRLPPPFKRTYPIGLDVEVCTFAALQRAWSEGHDPQHREHVMPFLYEGVQLTPPASGVAQGISPRGFRVALLHNDTDCGAYRWTVDTLEDLQFMREVYDRFGGEDLFAWRDLLALVHREPALAAINAGVRHKTLRDVDERGLKR
jgi:spore coat polysaccharide biosynthesis protein SpsF